MITLQSIDNFNIIKPLLFFPDKDSFYYIVIVPLYRKHKKYKAIKHYNIFSVEEFDACKEEITNICDSCNAKAYFYVNPRSYRTTALTYTKLLIDSINENHPLDFNEGYIGTTIYSFNDQRNRYILHITNSELLDTYIQIMNKVAKEEVSYTPIFNNGGVDLIIPKIAIGYFHQMCRINQIELPKYISDSRVLLYMKNVN